MFFIVVGDQHGFSKLDNVTHLQLSPPHQQCFCLCPGLAVAIKTPHSLLYSGPLLVSPTLNSTREKLCLTI